MSNLITLIKIQCLHLFNLNEIIHNPNKKARFKLVGIAALFLYIFVAFSFYIYFMFSSMADTLFLIDAIDTIIGCIFSVALGITLVTSVFKVSGLIINCKDDDLLSSLPIPKTTIMISRWLIMYTFNLIMIIIMSIPIIYIYLQYVNVSLYFYVSFSILILLSPLIPMIIGCSAGILLQFISKLFKKSNIINIILVFAALIAYFYFITSISYDNIGTYAAMFGNSLNKVYPLTTYYIEAICNNNVIALIVLILLNFGLFYVFTFIISKYYDVLVNMTPKQNKKQFKLTTIKSSSVLNTLIKKESKRYFSSTGYVVNTATGVLLQVIAVAYIVIQGIDSFEMILSIDGIESIIQAFIPLFLMATIGLSTTTSSSISLEGQQLWIIKSLPIDTMMIFKAKCAINFILFAPFAVLNVIVLSFFLKLKLTILLFYIIFIVLYISFMSMLGLIVNLLYPNFNWKNEMTVIKQSLPSFIIMIQSLATSIIIGYLLFQTSGNMLVIYAVFSLIVFGNVVCYVFLNTKGRKLFAKL